MMAAETGSLMAVLEVDTSKYKKSMEEAGKSAVDSSAKRVESAKAAETAEERAAGASERNAQRDVKAKKLQEKAAADLAKFEGEAVQERTIRIITAYDRERSAMKDLATARRIEKDGFGADGQAAAAVAVAYQRLTAAKLELAEATNVEAAAASHAHGVSDRMAASSLVRGLENGNVGIRTVENFITTIPGASRLLQGFFSVAGPLAFAAAVGEGVMKFVEMEQKALHAREAIAQAFLDQDQKARLFTDDLVIQADKLRDERDLLSGHPNDGLATGMDEARKRADKLLDSLQAVRKEEEAIFKETEVGMLAGIFSGTAPTGRQQKEFLKDNKQLQTDVSKIDDDAMERRAGTTDPKVIKAINAEATRLKRERFAKEEQAALAEAERLRQDEKDSLAAVVEAANAGRQPGKVVDNGPKIENAEGVARMMRRARLNETALQDVDDLQPQVAKLKQAKESKGESSRADEVRLKTMEAGLAAEKLQYDLSAKQIYDYWEARRYLFQAGSAAYNSIVEKQAAIAVEQATKAKEFIKKYTDDRKKAAADDQAELPKLLNRNAEEMRKGAVKGNGEQDQDSLSSNQLAIEEARNGALEREAFLNSQAGRTMTEYAAAIERANVHAEEFRTTMVALQGIVDTRKTLADADPSRENKAQLAKAQRDLDDAKSQRGIQMGADDGAIYGLPSSALVGGSDALREFIRSVTDSATEMKHFTEQGLRGFNDALLKVLTGQSGRGGAGRVFQDFGSNLFRQGAGSLLQNAEGSTMKMLGLGDGGAAKFLSSHSSGIGGFIGKLLGVGATAAGGFGADGLGGISSKWLNSGMNALPHFAAGGAIDAATASIIGEKGPELFIPQSAGTIVPNNKLMGGGGGASLHMDFTGANFSNANPAQIEASMRRANRDTLMKAVSSALLAMNEQQARRPR